MNQGPEDRLDGAIDRLLGIDPQPSTTPSGDELEAKLAQFAAMLRERLPAARPSEAAIARGREKLLAELDALPRSPVAGTRALPVSWNSRHTWSVAVRSLLVPTSLVGRAAVIASLLVAALALNGTLAASAGSLPGDPLYDLKRIQEQVRLTIALDDNARADLQQQMDETRVLELSAVRSMQRVARTDVSGMVNRVDGDTVVVDAIPFVVERARFPDVANVVTGDRVTLGVQTNGDGSVLVIAFRREPRTASSASAGPRTTNIPTATARPAGAGSPVPTAQRNDSPTPAPMGGAAPATQQNAAASTTATASATHVSSSTPQPSPTLDEGRRPTITETLVGTPTSAVTRRPTPAGTDGTFAPRPKFSPVPSETPRSGPRASRTPEPTETPEPSDTARPQGTRQPFGTPRPRDTDQPNGNPQPTDAARPRATPDPDDAP